MHLLHVCVCWSSERIAPSVDVRAFAAQSVRQLLSVHWMRSALSVIHCLILSDWLAFLLQGKTGWSGVGLSWPGISRSFHTTSHWNCILSVSAWILKHSCEVRCRGKKKQKRLLIVEKKCNCCHFFCITHSAGFHDILVRQAIFDLALSTIIFLSFQGMHSDLKLPIPL